MINCEDCDSRQCLETGVCDKKKKPFDFSDAVRTANQSCSFIGSKYFEVSPSGLPRSLKEGN